MSIEARGPEHDARMNMTHTNVLPVLVSKIRAQWLQPVARYRPFAEKLTQHTALGALERF